MGSLADGLYAVGPVVEARLPSRRCDEMLFAGDEMKISTIGAAIGAIAVSVIGGVIVIWYERATAPTGELPVTTSMPMNDCANGPCAFVAVPEIDAPDLVKVRVTDFRINGLRVTFGVEATPVSQRARPFLNPEERVALIGPPDQAFSIKARRGHDVICQEDIDPEDWQQLNLTPTPMLDVGEAYIYRVTMACSRRPALDDMYVQMRIFTTADGRFGGGYFNAYPPTG